MAAKLQTSKSKDKDQASQTILMARQGKGKNERVSEDVEEFYLYNFM